ncbi:aldo/keto reductase [Sphingobacterium sp. N143]|uniref:aldo/keto reductase n=1 Tax=Sphingobacterium sp. N143 TaxID=2746727 RepID=UPI0025764328|nr:aldo/keto reductase [Sphingobacterium sp. N143]MDM1296434.1 aldo/keto reductase [Sphingobacterium sp. N143]
MKQRRLGHSGIMVSEIGLGCMSLKSNQPKQAKDIIQKAFDKGITFFDTADLYDKGQNEMVVGESLQAFRKQIVLATKVGNLWRADGSGWDWKASKEYILKAIEGSLSRLKTDYIDLYQLHGGTIDDPIDEIIEAFELLKQQGKIRAYGLSSIRPNVIKTFLSKAAISTVMMQYSLLDRRLEEDVDALLMKHEVSILIRGALAKGVLLNKPIEPYLQYSSGEVAHVLRNLDNFVKRMGKSRAEGALSYVLSNPATATAVVGISTKLQLDELIATKEQIIQLDSTAKKELLDGVRSFYYTEHR